MTTDSNSQLSIAVDDCHCSALSALQYKLEVKKQYFCVSYKVIRYYVNLYGLYFHTATDSQPVSHAEIYYFYLLLWLFNGLIDMT